jgi:hypothetical protein
MPCYLVILNNPALWFSRLSSKTVNSRSASAASPKPLRHLNQIDLDACPMGGLHLLENQMKARITKQVLTAFREAFIPDLSSPSGLRWNRWNGCTGTRSREAGDVAGGSTNNGTYVVTLSGEKYLAMDVLVALHRAQHRTAVVSA